MGRTTICSSGWDSPPLATCFLGALLEESKQRKGFVAVFGWLAVSRSGDKPGFGPAAELLSFASPKESNQRKGEPRPCRFAVPCATRSVRGGCAHPRPGSLRVACPPLPGGDTSGPAKPVARCPWYGLRFACRRGHLTPLLIPHHGQPQGLPLRPSKTAAEPKLRHSAPSRGIHVPLHSNIDAATTRSMTACAGQRCPPSPTPFPVIPHSSSGATTRVAPTPLKDSGRTQTSSFRAQSRNPCSPALQLGCCDYAQHDGVCRAPLPPITHTIRRHSSLLTHHHGQPQGFPLHPSKTAAEPKLRHSARSRGIHVPLHSNIDAATTRSMTACAGQRCPPSPTPFPVIPHSSSWATTRVAPTPLKDSGRTQTSSFRAQSRNPCSPALQLGCCDYAQHDGVCRAPLPPITHSIRRHSSLLTHHHGQPQGLPLRPSKTAAEPKLRHSARSRGIHVPLHSNIDAATTRSMTACAGQRCPPSPTPFPVIPHSSSWATTRVAPTPLGDSGRTQTPSFRAQSRNPCSPALHDYAQHDGVCRAPLPPITHTIPRHSSPLTPHHGQPQGLPLRPSKTAAEPKLRHSARSRGIHVPLHSNIDAATTRSMTACAGQRCPPSPTPFPVIPHSSSGATTRVAPTPLKDSGRTQTPSFRAQSRNPCSPALKLGCCDYAQHDGVCRAPLPPITHTIRRHSSLLTHHHGQPQGLPLPPSKTAAEPKLRHSARSRGIHVPLHSNIDAATTRSMTACAGQRCPPSPTPFPVIPHSSSWATTRLPLHPSKTAAEPKLRHSVRSRGIHVPLHSNLDAATTRSMTACAGHRCPPSPTAFAVIPHSSPIIMGNHKGCPYAPQRQRQNPNSVIPRAVAESMFPCTPT